MSQLRTDDLARLVQQKLQHLSQLRELGVKQGQCIESGDMAGLLRVLSAKQHLISCLQQTEGELDTFRDEEPEQRVWRSDDDRRHCADQAQQSHDLLQEVLELERKNEASMVMRRHDTMQRLAKLHTVGRARGAYADQPRTAGPHSATSQATSPAPGQGTTVQGSIDLVSEA